MYIHILHNHLTGCRMWVCITQTAKLNPLFHVAPALQCEILRSCDHGWSSGPQMQTLHIHAARVCQAQFQDWESGRNSEQLNLWFSEQISAPLSGMSQAGNKRKSFTLPEIPPSQKHISLFFSFNRHRFVVCNSSRVSTWALFYTLPSHSLHQVDTAVLPKRKGGGKQSLYVGLLEDTVLHPMLLH